MMVIRLCWYVMIIKFCACKIVEKVIVFYTEQAHYGIMSCDVTSGVHSFAILHGVLLYGSQGRLANTVRGGT